MSTDLEAAPVAAGQHRNRRTGAWNLVAVAAAAGLVALTAGPVSDLDVFWHVEVGAYTLAGDGFPHPDPWAFTRPGTHWHSTAWLSELVLAAVQHSTGWLGVVVLRLLLTLGLVAALARLLLRRDRGWAGPLVFTVCALPLIDFVQERPQTASLLFVVWLAGRVTAFQDTGALPSRWRFVAVTWLWAMVHGLFVLAPGLLALLALGQLLDRGRAGWPVARSLLTTAGLAVVVATLTPMGPRLLLAPLTVSRAARGYIAEWAPTTVEVHGAFGLFALLALLLLAWGRSTERVARSEVGYVLVLALFGLLAIRNAGPAALLLAPVALRRLTRAWDTSSDLTVPRRTLVVVAVLALGAAVASYARFPVLPEGRPTQLAARLAAQPEPLRVLNDYNVSGFLISEGGPRLRLAVDGRADRYGHDFLQRYRSMTSAGPDWRADVDNLRPDVAVLLKASALAQLLVAERQWRVVETDHDFALLAALDVVLSP